MAKQYVFPPGNWEEVSRGMILSGNEIISTLLKAKRWLFYDTCALMHHAHPECSDAMIQYIKKHQGIVILLQIIVMELSSESGGNVILQEHAQYIRKIIKNDIPVIFMAEEECCRILQAVMQTDKAERNGRFTYAVRHLRGGNGGIGKALDTLADAEKKRMVSGNPVQEELGLDAIKAIRSGKRQRDSLGEDMIFYCMIMLAPLFYPMVVFSDDRAAFDRFCRTADYIKEHYQRKEIQCYSFVHLCHIMFQQDILGENEVEGFLGVVYKKTEKIGFRGITAQDVDAEERKEPIEEMARLIREDKELRIII